MIEMIGKFQKIYRQIINEQLQNDQPLVSTDNNIISIYIGSQWNSPEQVENLKKQWLQKFNINAIFHDGSDYYSGWTLEGSTSNLRALLDKEWNFSEDDMFEDCILNFEGDYNNLKLIYPDKIEEIQQILEYNNLV